jgi:type IV fimbrial biogenesis protein FimT
MRPHRRPPSDRGVTLIEVMIVVTILGILLATALPSFATLLSNQRATSAVNDLSHALAVARNEAMKRGRRVYVAPIDGAHWRGGWAVFVDRNDNRLFDASTDELILRHAPLADTITTSNPANPLREPFTDVGSPQRTYVMFDGTGYARQRNGGFEAGSISIVDHTSRSLATRTLCLASLGRVRVTNRSAC